MAYGKNGATCWLAGAVRTLQKRVEMLEGLIQERGVQHHANTSVSRHKSDGDFEIQNTSPKVRETSSSELGVELGIKVNLHTPRICEENVPRDRYGNTCLVHVRRCRILLRL